ncbi:MAG TPA: hypothetical protein VFZ69_15115 [Longimicrobiales bacterium]
MERFLAKVGLAARRLRREPGFTAAAIITLAVGIGIAAAGFALVDGSLLHGTVPDDPLTLAAMTTLLFGAALVASYIPARRTSRIDPVHALRAA